VAGNATALMRLLGRLKYLAGRSGKAARPTGADVFQARSLRVGMVGDDVAFWDKATFTAQATRLGSVTASVGLFAICRWLTLFVCF
jgi:hypothetical protein